MSRTKRRAPGAAKQKQEQEQERGESDVNGQGERPSKRSKSSDAREAERKKDSHLYTDDNPSTTLHGTSFKDAQAARKTIEMVSARRSLTYQFQTINTMLHRAKGHPSKSQGIKAAIPIFQEWVDGYQSRKASLRPFVLLKKERVQRYLRYVDQNDAQHAEEAFRRARSWAERYVALKPKKRLANTLMDDADPAGQDLESHRYKSLCDIVPDVPRDAWQQEDLWTDVSKKVPSATHLKMLLYAYSPLGNA